MPERLDPAVKRQKTSETEFVTRPTGGHRVSHTNTQTAKTESLPQEAGKKSRVVGTQEETSDAQFDDFKKSKSASKRAVIHESNPVADDIDSARMRKGFSAEILSEMQRKKNQVTVNAIRDQLHWPEYNRDNLAAMRSRFMGASRHDVDVDFKVAEACLPKSYSNTKYKLPSDESSADDFPTTHRHSKGKAPSAPSTQTNMAKSAISDKPLAMQTDQHSLREVPQVQPVSSGPHFKCQSASPEPSEINRQPAKPRIPIVSQTAQTKPNERKAITPAEFFGQTTPQPTQSTTSLSQTAAAPTLSKISTENQYGSETNMPQTSSLFGRPNKAEAQSVSSSEIRGSQMTPINKPLPHIPEGDNPNVKTPSQLLFETLPKTESSSAVFGLEANRPASTLSPLTGFLAQSPASTSLFSSKAESQTSQQSKASFDKTSTPIFGFVSSTIANSPSGDLQPSPTTSMFGLTNSQNTSQPLALPKNSIPPTSISALFGEQPTKSSSSFALLSSGPSPGQLPPSLMSVFNQPLSTQTSAGLNSLFPKPSSQPLSMNPSSSLFGSSSVPKKSDMPTLFNSFQKGE